MLCDGEPTLLVANWFHQYLDSVKSLPGPYPGSSMASEPGMAYPFVVDAATCSVCRASALKDIIEFSALLTGQIELSISQVGIHQISS